MCVTGKKIAWGRTDPQKYDGQKKVKVRGQVCKEVTRDNKHPGKKGRITTSKRFSLAEQSRERADLWSRCLVAGHCELGVNKCGMR